MKNTKLGRKHPSRDVMFSGQNSATKMQIIITSHDVLEPSKPVLSASCDVIISGQKFGSKLQRVFTLGDGCKSSCAWRVGWGNLVLSRSQSPCPSTGVYKTLPACEKGLGAKAPPRDHNIGRASTLVSTLVLS